MAWSLTGEYFENCNCDILCPCITSSMQEPADAERCYVPLICHIDEGSSNGVSLNDLNFIMVVDSPAIMGEGNWRVAVYVDERADESQRGALHDILSGDHGGPPEMLKGLIGEVLGLKFVPINYESNGIRKRVDVPGIMEFEVEGVLSPVTSKVMEITSTVHPMGEDLPIARSTIGSYHDADYDWSFDNKGKNGHYREFAWQGG